jgi:hypothetical protein
VHNNLDVKQAYQLFVKEKERQIEEEEQKEIKSSDVQTKTSI